MTEFREIMRFCALWPKVWHIGLLSRRLMMSALVTTLAIHPLAHAQRTIPVEESATDSFSFRDYTPPGLDVNPRMVVSKHKSDPFYSGGSIPEGPLAGQMADDSLKKTLKILTVNDPDPDVAALAAYFPHVDGTVLVANFYHGTNEQPGLNGVVYPGDEVSDFWIARIPVAFVKEVDLLLQVFAKLPGIPDGKLDIAHTMLRFLFEDGHAVELLARMPKYKEFKRDHKLELLKEPVRLQEIMTSIDATGIAGKFWEFSLPKGVSIPSPLAFLPKNQFVDLPEFKRLRQPLASSSYAITVRAMSSASKLIEVNKLGHPMRSLRLSDLDRKEKSHLLLAYLELAHRAGQGQMYDLIRQNCTNLLVLLIEEIRPLKQAARNRLDLALLSFVDKVGGITEFFPAWVVWGLVVKRVAKWTDFRTEQLVDLVDHAVKTDLLARNQTGQPVLVQLKDPQNLTTVEVPRVRNDGQTSSTLQCSDILNR